MYDWIAIIAGIGASVLGFFMVRTMRQLDNTVGTLTTEVTELKSDRKVQVQLNEFLDKRLVAVEAENSKWRRIIGSIDKIIYAKLGIDISTL